MLVLDANILIRAVLGRRVRDLIEQYSTGRIRFYAPDVAFADAEKYLPIILASRNLSTSDVSDSLEYLSTLIESVDVEIYHSHERSARKRLSGRDEEDWPILALALALNCPIWTEDTDFFGTGVPVWTTNRIEIFLSEQTANSESE